VAVGAPLARVSGQEWECPTGVRTLGASTSGSLVTERGWMPARDADRALQEHAHPVAHESLMRAQR
jgi:hypothetical protein